MRFVNLRHVPHTTKRDEILRGRLPLTMIGSAVTGCFVFG